jgi:hypothetical protein
VFKTINEVEFGGSQETLRRRRGTRLNGEDEDGVVVFLIESTKVPRQLGVVRGISFVEMRSQPLLACLSSASNIKLPAPRVYYNIHNI